MTLYLGTLDGLYRVPDLSFDDIEKIHTGASEPYIDQRKNNVFARADGELYHSTDDGQSWTRLETPDERVTALQPSPSGEALYLGTHPPAELHVSHDGGDSWRPLETFPDFPPIKRYAPEEEAIKVHSEAQIHELRIHPDRPEQIIAGLKPHGVVVSEDGGESWEFRRNGLHRAVHDIELLGPETFLTATGQGLYLTEDAGRSWERQDVYHTYFEYTYFYGLVVTNDTIFTAAAAKTLGDWGGKLGLNAVLIEAAIDGGSYTHTPYPGGPEEFPVGWATYDGRILAGTMAQDFNDPGTAQARVLGRTTSGRWETLGIVPAGVITIQTT